MDINRRKMLQLGTVAMAGSTLGARIPFALAKETIASNFMDGEDGSEIYHNACPRNCHDSCSLYTEVKDGKIVRIYGDRFFQITAGTPCVKGQAYVEKIYSKERILKPLKRTGMKGEGKWQEISWDEALTTIADRLKKTIDEYGGSAILPYTYSGNLSIVADSFPGVFFTKVGASVIRTTVCDKAGEAGIPTVYGTFDRGLDITDISKSKLYISWGHNETATAVHSIKFINEAKAKGTKVVVVNVDRTPVASQADMFLHLKPGSDASLALAVAKVMIEEELYDKSFVSQYVLGFDELVKQAKETPMSLLCTNTGLNEGEIVEFARLYAANQPALLRIGYGMQRHLGGGKMTRAIAMLAALTGNIGHESEGGGFIYINVNQYSGNYGVGYDRMTPIAPRTQTVNFNELGKALAAENPMSEGKAITPIKFLCVYSSNPVCVTQGVNNIVKGLKREDLFTVVLEQYMTDTADYADIILPACTFFETDDLLVDYFGRYVQLNELSVKPLGESLSNMHIFQKIAQKMGYTDPAWTMSTEEFIKGHVDGSQAFKDRGITYDLLKKYKWQRYGSTPAEKNALKFSTPSGKIEFYSEAMKQNGFNPVMDIRTLKDEVESRLGDGYTDKYPYNIVSPSTELLLNSQWANIKYIKILTDAAEPVILINPADAADLDVSNGDFLQVSNDIGSVKFKVKVSTKTVPGAFITYKGMWAKQSDDKSTVNMLVHENFSDMGLGSSYHSAFVKAEKA